MSLISAVRSLASSLFRRSQVDREVAEELRSHIEHRAEDLERSGVARREAERRARVEFGGYERYKAESHEAMGGGFIEVLLQDVRFGFRMMRKSPGFTVVAVLTLALGIGANAVVFSALNALILQPIHVPNAQSLYMVERGKELSAQHSYPDYLDLRDQNRSFSGLMAYSISRAGLATDGKASAAWLYEVSGNYFDVAEIQPHLGRFFHSSDEHGPNSSPYIVLSYAYWRSHFQSDPGVVGRGVLLNKHSYTILGVAPEEFRGTELFFSPDFWVPLVNQEQVEGWSNLTARGARGIWVDGRLKPGVTAEQATEDLNAIGARLAKAYPKDDDQSSFALARPGLMGDTLGQPVRAFLGALMLLAGLILLATCANLGSLFAARARDRSKEIALRLALGSSRQRILRQLLTEAVMIALMGGAAGLVGGLALLRWLSTWQPVPSFPISLPVNADANVYVVALGLALASGLLCGIIPIRQIFRADPYQIVKSGYAGKIGRRFGMRDVLLVVQISACAVLVTSSLVAVRGLVRSLHSSFGFLPQSTLLVDTDLDMAGYSGEQVQLMQKRMLEAVRAIPGVTAAGLSDRIPLGMGWGTSAVFKDSTTDLKPSNAVAEAVVINISPEYLHAAGTGLLAGRAFTVNDDAKAPKVAIVNREFASKVLGSTTDAVGRFYKTTGGTRIQVVGIVEDGKYMTLTEDAQPAMFLPILQSPTSSTFLVVRTDRDVQEMSAAIDRSLHGLDAGLPFAIRTWNRELDSALFAPRAATVSLGVLGGLGAMLAVTGIFGMASYSVSKRLREFGIRIALGAQRREVLGAALGKAFRLLAFGSGIGLLLGIAAAKVLSSIVYQATPRDPLVLAGVVVSMLLLGLMATWIPAQRALGADPLILLREE
jgi:predicted permease